MRRALGRLEAVAGPGSGPVLVGLVLLAGVRALGLVAIADGLAGAIAIAAGDGGALADALFGAAAGVLAVALAGWASSVVAWRGAAATKRRLRAAMLDRVVTGGPLDADAVRDATRGLDDLDAYATTVIPAAVAAIVVPVVLGARILAADPLSAAIVAITLPLVPVFMVLIGMHTRERVEAADRALGTLAGHIRELAQGLPVLVGLGRDEQAAQELGRLQDDYDRRTVRTLRSAFLSALALELVATLSVAVVAVALGLRLLAGSIGLADALLVLLLAPDCFAVLRDVGAAFHASRNGRAALTRVRELLDSPAGEAPRDGELGLDDVEVHYPGRVRPAVRVRTARFGPGITAITGASGAGKSTLLAAIAGTLPPEAVVRGRVRVPAGGVAYAPQHPTAFAETVLDELLLFAGGDRAAVERRLDDLGLRPVAGLAPALLSPGESRRLGVARALLRVDAGARIVLLDEPTAHLDASSAAGVRAAITALPASTTVLLVSHDPVTVAMAQETLALDGSPQVKTVEASPVSSVPTGPVRVPAGASSSGAVRRWLLLAGVIAPDAGRWALAVLLGVLATGLGLSLTAASAWLIVRAAQQPELMVLSVVIVGVRFFGLGRSVSRYLERLVTHRAVFAGTGRLRLRLWRGIAARGASSRDLLEGGRAEDYLVGLVTELRDQLPRVLLPPLVGILTIAGITICAAVLAPGFGLVVGAVLLILLALAGTVAWWRDRAGQAEAVAARSDLRRRWDAIAVAAPLLRANGVIADAATTVAAASERQAVAERRSVWAAGLATALVVAGCGGLAVAVAALAAPMGFSGEVTAVLALLALAAAEPVAAAIASVQRVPAALSILGRLDRLAAPVPLRGGSRPVSAVRSVQLDGVAARWPGADTPVSSPVNAEVRAPGWLVLDGPSGSGKSTILTVLMGSLPASAGRVLVDGTPLDDLDAGGWRTRVAWCPQEAHVFDSTVRGNLSIATPGGRDATADTDLLEVLERVGLGSLLSGAEAGLDLRVGPRGRALSGGERQRLAVARALLTDADVILLDEPTAHLDEPGAAAMMTDLRRAVGDRIVVLVSHRTADREPGDHVVELRPVVAPPARAATAASA